MPPGRERWRARYARMGGRGPRPPWWPEGEAWPPAPEAWHEARRRFLRRAGVFAFLLLAIFGSFIGLLGWLIGRAFGTGWSGGLAIALLAIGFLVVARWALRSFRATAAPIGDLVDAAARVEAGELGVQVAERGPREVRGLAGAFNAMSARLARTEDQRRTLFAEVSHELRTPLTVIQGNLEAMIDGVYPADREHLELVQAEAQHLERLVDDLRTLSLADAGALTLNREPADLSELAHEVVDGFGPQASAASVALSAEGSGPEELELDPHRMRQVITNLVANALRHTPAGGSISVTVAGDDTVARLAVRDTGSGMTPEQASHAFDRFWRSGEAAGAGLGLAIVHDLVAAHGGTTELASTPGEGTIVTCTFPRRPPG